MPRASPLQRMLHPLRIDEFVGKYFQRAPVKVSGTPGKFDFLFKQEEFQTGLDRVTEIRAVFPQQWQAQIHAGDIKQMLHAGATICVTGIDKAHPKLSKAAARIRSELSFAGDVSFRAYLSPPDRGFDLHFDARVATTLQIAGTKRWWYSTEPATAFPLYNSGREPAGSARNYTVPKLKSLRSVLLRPGDLLCLPAGVWHCANATTTSLALNMAFDHCGASVFDTITGALQKRLMQDARWREPLPVVLGPKSRTLPQSVASVMRDRIDALQAELSRLRDSEEALAAAWRMSVLPKPFA